MAIALPALIPRLRALLATGFMAAVVNERDGLPLLRSLAHPLDAEGAGSQRMARAQTIVWATARAGSSASVY